MWKWLTILLLLSPKTGIYTQAPPAPDDLITHGLTTHDPIISCAPPGQQPSPPTPTAAMPPYFPAGVIIITPSPPPMTAPNIISTRV